jgi:hypothetical protein
LPDKYLLYIDILGFRELVRADPARVTDLYQVVASLNAHRHESFATIVFSDTILVYNLAEVTTEHDREYAVMYLCEFAQDLLHRLVGRSVTFRAVLTSGSFEHYYLDKVPCFFGTALIDAYEAEKAIKAIGLFMHRSCLPHNRIFPTRAIDGLASWSFVFLTQQMTEFENLWQGELPLPAIAAIDMDMGWFLGPEILYLAFLFEQAKTHPDPLVRAKYQTTWFYYSQQYPLSTKSLVAADFDLSAVSPEFPWERLRAGLSESYARASRRRTIRPRMHKRIRRTAIDTGK